MAIIHQHPTDYPNCPFCVTVIVDSDSFLCQSWQEDFKTSLSEIGVLAQTHWKNCLVLSMGSLSFQDSLPRRCCHPDFAYGLLFAIYFGSWGAQSRWPGFTQHRYRWAASYHTWAPTQLAYPSAGARHWYLLEMVSWLTTEWLLLSCQGSNHAFLWSVK